MEIGPRKVDKPLVLYGYGKLGHLAEEIFKELKIPIYGIMENSSRLDGSDPRNYLLAVCVTTEPYQQVIKPLVTVGWDDIVPVWNIIEAYPEVGIHNGWFTGEITRQDIVEIREINNNWDYESFYHYESFYLWHTKRLEIPRLNYPIDTTTLSLPSTLADIRARQTPYRILSGNCDNIEIHNEGCELQTLEWSIKELKKYRPKISCSCYHSRDGLWKIEKFLMANLSDYKWTFRCHAYMGQAAFIYGTPKERTA